MKRLMVRERKRVLALAMFAGASAMFAGAMVSASSAKAQDAAPAPVTDGAPDVAAGETLYQAVCRNCHGPKAKGMASFPKLTGFDAEHLTMRLEQYRAGETVGPNTPLMAPMAVGLSDEDIANLAAYITETFD